MNNHPTDSPSIAELSGKKILFLISYNPAPDNAWIYKEGDCLVVELGCTFNQTGRHEDKSPSNVHAEDPRWKFLLLCIALGMDIVAIILHLGYIQSGSGAMIRLAKQTCAGREELLRFLVCHHDLAEKRRLLRDAGFGEWQCREFVDAKAVKDPQHRCEEWDAMRRYAADIAGENA